MDSVLGIAIGIILGCMLALSWLAGSDAPFVPTTRKKMAEAFKVFGLKKDQIFYELGSGDGRLVFEAAKVCKKAVGIEQSILRIWYSKFLAWQKNLPNTEFIHGNIFKKDLSNADVIYIYLLPRGVDKLEPKLKNELKKGSKVVTLRFHFKNWKPLKTVGDFQVYKV